MSGDWGALPFLSIEFGNIIFSLYLNKSETLLFPSILSNRETFFFPLLLFVVIRELCFFSLLIFLMNQRLYFFNEIILITNQYIVKCWYCQCLTAYPDTTQWQSWVASFEPRVHSGASSAFWLVASSVLKTSRFLSGFTLRMSYHLSKVVHSTSGLLIISGQHFTLVRDFLTKCSALNNSFMGCARITPPSIMDYGCLVSASGFPIFLPPW